MNFKRLLKLSLPIFFFILSAGAIVASSQTPKESLSIANLAVPETLGKVQERFNGGSSRWIIHIQDVHAHFVAQENISAIVDHLHTLYGINTIALEGGWDSTDLPNSRKLPQSREKQMLARALLEEEYITGPVFTALFAQSPIWLRGIEESELYEENRFVYLEHFSKRADIEATLQQFKDKLEIKKKNVFNYKLLFLEKTLAEYREGTEMEEFIYTLLRLAEENSISSSDLRQISLFKQATELENSLDKEKLESEASRLMAPFKNQRLSLEELLRSGKISAEKISHYSETQKFRQLMELRDQLYYEDFFGQIETLIQRLKEALIVSKDEGLLDIQLEHFYLARKILRLEATPKDLRIYEEEQEGVEALMSEAGLSKAFTLSLEFYKLAKKRDDVFLDKLLFDKTLSGNIAVVTGGFHTDALSQQLRESGVSYIVITPDLGDKATDHELYAQRLQDVIARQQTLAPMQNRVLMPAFDKAFPKAVLFFQKTNDQSKAIEGFRKLLAGTFTPSVVAQKPVAQAGAIRFEDFLALSEKEQVAKLQEWAKIDVAFAIAFRQALFEETLFQIPFSLSRFREMRNNRLVTMVALLEGAKPHIELIGGMGPLVRIANTIDWTEALQTPSVQRRAGRLLQSGRMGAIERDLNGQTQNLPIAVFPPVQGVLLLLPAILQGQLMISDDPNIRAQFWAVIQNLLSYYTSINELMRAA